MNILQTQWWEMDLPDEWRAEEDDDLILISDVDDVGEIAISTLAKEDGVVDEQELAQFSAEVEQAYGKGKTLTIGDWRGVYFQFNEDSDAVREWYLYQDNLLVLITYSCDLENAGMDDAVVDEIVATLYISRSSIDDQGL